MHSIKWISGTDNLGEAKNIRDEVFIKEQGVPPELEFDGSDKYAISILIYDDDKAVATGRIILIDEVYTLGRICVLKDYRNKNYGSVVINELSKKAKELGASSVHIHAQTHVLKFYEKLGFISYGKEYKEAGINHISMKKDL